ncbi:MAG TPA: hypothetical protein VFG54_00790 [Prolixibacteraceae bacterium]|nr:hypothetical protein [Prolixibacteraceae bacterium]
MNIWYKVRPWLDRDYYAFTTISIIISLLSISHFVTKDKIHSDNDLIRIEGEFIDYSFQHGSRGNKMYYFWLKEFNCTFQIPADYLDSFDKNRFISNVRINEILVLYISKKQFENLNLDKRIFVQHIEKEKLIFLNKRDSIEQESGFGEIYFGVAFFIAGLVYFRIRTTIWKPRIKY